MKSLGQKEGAVASAASTHDIIRNAREAGIDRFDPFWPFIETLCRTTAEMAGTSDDVRRVGAEVIQEIRRAHDRLDAKEGLIFRAFVQRAVRKTAMRWTAIVVGAMLIGHGGYYLGRAKQDFELHSSSVVLRADGSLPENIKWLQIQTWNSVNSMLSACRPELDGRDAEKPRLYCWVPIYIESSK